MVAAVTWACDRFSDYLMGLVFHVETDHKPLVPLLSAKRLDELPLRIQRFRMRMMRYTYTISHVPGKSLITADTLSRAPEEGSDEDTLQEETKMYVHAVFESIPATEMRLEEIRMHQEEDEITRQIATYCQTGWPARNVGCAWGDQALLLCSVRVVSGKGTADAWFSSGDSILPSWTC